MAGFLNALSFLAPVGQTLGPAMQIGARQAQAEDQRQKSQNAFGKLLDNLGPEYEPFRQWFKAGGAPHDVMAGIGGPIGERLQQQHKTELTNQILSDPKLSPAEKNQRLFENNLISGESFMKTLTATQPQQKVTGNFNDFLALKGLTLDDFNKKSPAEKQALLPEFEQFKWKQTGGGAGGDDIEWKSLFNPKTGNIELTAVPKHARPGTIAGLGAPRAGSSAQAEVTTAQTNLQDIGQTLKSIKGGISSVPMWATVYKMRAGLPVDANDSRLLGQVSTLQTSLVGLVMRSWGSRNAQAAKDFIDLHVPKPGDSPALINQKVQEWTRPGGYLDLYRGMSGMVSESELQQRSGLTGGGDNSEDGWENPP